MNIDKQLYQIMTRVLYHFVEAKPETWATTLSGEIAQILTEAVLEERQRCAAIVNKHVNMEFGPGSQMRYECGYVEASENILLEIQEET